MTPSWPICFNHAATPEKSMEEEDVRRIVEGTVIASGRNVEAVP